MLAHFQDRCRVLRAVLSPLIIIAASAHSLLAQGTPTFTNVSVHDPSVIKDGSTYYVLGSFLASASSTDLMNWQQVTSGWDATTHPTNSLIKDGSPQTQFADALAYAHLSTDTSPPGFWGPDWIKLGDGRYYLYYCVCNGTSRAALGVAVANSVTGPYSNVGILLESGMWGLPSPDGTTYDNAVHPNVVDPSVFFDNAGKLWMVYGSYSGGIFTLALDPTTGQPLAGQAYGKKLIGGNNCTIEGAYITYSTETSYYYLFCTFGGLAANGGYNIRMGRSRNPDGPYLDAAGNDLTNVKGAFGTVFDNASIAPYGVKLMGNCQFLHVAGDPQTTSRGYVSPGGVSITRDATTGKYLMVFHTRFVGQGEYHEVRVHQLFLNADGWFVVAPQRYAQETVATADVTKIPGDYKLINHGKDITATVKTSTVITLNADQSVSGAVAGTWQLSGDHYATLTLGGISYHGVFVRLWDDDNQVWSLTFSAISTDGVSVWGNKVAVAPAGPAITAQPASQTAASGHGVSFQVVAAGSTAYMWQESTNGGSSWTTLVDNSTFSGTSTDTLTINSAGAGMDAYRYRTIVSNGSGTTTSNAAILGVVTPTFPSPVDVALSATGNLLVSDNSKNTIQTVSGAGAATLLAGSPGQQGAADGTGSLASFRLPGAMALDAAGNLYVADTGNSLIRKITAGGAVTTFAGSASDQSYRDGTGTAAWFNKPAGLAIDGAGDLYVADTGNSVIRKITPSGVVTTLAGTAGVRGSTDGAGSAAQFNQPAGIGADSVGNIYVADTLNQTIRRITPSGNVTTWAGLAGVVGSSDGSASGALFNNPRGVAFDAGGNLYIADTGNSTVRLITSTGAVSTFAGLAGISGFKDGIGPNAWFNQPMGLRLDGSGNLYVADNGNAAIRRISAGGTVATWVISQTTPTPDPTPTPTPTPPPTPSPTPSTGGGGGGNMSMWFLAALTVLGSARRFAQMSRGRSRGK